MLAGRVMQRRKELEVLGGVSNGADAVAAQKIMIAGGEKELKVEPTS